MAKSFVWRTVDLIVGAVFILAAFTKLFDIPHLDLHQFRPGDLVAFLLGFLQQLRFADPMAFAGDIDNYKILPWTISIALAFYLPWLEIFCGLALILRRLYLGGLSILTALVAVFIVATIAARIRGIDFTCGCFGHASKNWSFTSHLALDLAILAALLALYFKVASGNRLQMPPNSC